MEDDQGKVVMVTGAAGNLGSAVSRAYLERSAHLILVDYADVILFLTSDAARDIHGVALPVYGS